MSGQRSDWRERLHANPSRMEQEVEIKLQDDRIATSRGLSYRFGVKLLTVLAGSIIVLFDRVQFC
jgi:hypothetical protein